MRKRRKLKKKNLSFLFIILILIGGILYITMFKQNKVIYKAEAYEKLSKDKQAFIEKQDYSKTLEEILLNNLFEEKYFNDYLKIKYQERNDFLNEINSLLNKGYNSEEINNIYTLSNNNISKVLKSEYLNINKYYAYKNFDVNNYKRYEAYEKSNDYTVENIITYVNVGADLKPYENTTVTDDPDNYLVIVNKFNGIAKNYEPADLVATTGYYNNNVYVRKVAKEALSQLQKDIKEEIGTTLLPTTAYRGYSFQKTLYDNYVANDGVTKADTYSARPGFSEHQTGLAIDLKNPKLTNIRLDEKDYSWLKENAYKYGFIIRYPKDKEFLTCYEEENWHIRYVGKDAAKIIKDNKLCLEEYIDLYVKEY